MIINKHPYTGTISRPTSIDIAADTQGYKAILTVQCDIQRNDEKGASGVYEFTHKIWWWNDARVTFNGSEMSWEQYLVLSGRTTIKEGLYFQSSMYDKAISGEIKLYNPSQFGVMLGIDTNSI